MREKEITGFIIIMTAFLIMAYLENQITIKTALAQTTATKSAMDNTVSMNGAISSLVLGVSPKTKIVDITTVQKFILSGDWSMSIDKGKLTGFSANFYTGPANGGTSNHTHQITNFR